MTRINHELIERITAEYSDTDLDHWKKEVTDQRKHVARLRTQLENAEQDLTEAEHTLHGLCVEIAKHESTYEIRENTGSPDARWKGWEVWKGDIPIARHLASRDHARRWLESYKGE